MTSVNDGKLAGWASRKKLIGRSAGEFGKRLAARSTRFLGGGGDIEAARLQDRTFVQGKGDAVLKVKRARKEPLPAPRRRQGTANRERDVRTERNAISQAISRWYALCHCSSGIAGPRSQPFLLAVSPSRTSVMASTTIPGRMVRSTACPAISRRQTRTPDRQSDS